MCASQRVLAVILTAVSLAAVGCDGGGVVSAHSEEETDRTSQSESQSEGSGPEKKPDDGNLVSIHLTRKALERAEIRTDSVRTGRLETSVTAPARVEYDADRIAHVSPLVEGQVSDVKVSLGEPVEAGQVVAEMRSVALGDARGTAREAEARLNVARRHFERQKKLRGKGINSERELIDARGELDEARAQREAATARLRSYGVSDGSGPRYPVRTGIDGTIIKRNVAQGETKGPTDRLFVVADRRSVWVVGDVYESDIHHIEEGMQAVVTLEAYPKSTWRGRVDWIGERLEGNSRVLPVRVVLENDDGRLHPGMFGELQLMPASIDNPVPLVPIGAVQRIDGDDAVFVPGDDPGLYHARRVETGAESGGLVEIRRGLNAEDKVVTDGAYDLKIALRSK